MIIPWWSTSDKVRVCDSCFTKKDIPEPVLAPGAASTYRHSPTFNYNTQQGVVPPVNQNPANDVIARKVTETMQETIGLIGYATKLPFDVLKESARPSYWKPDSECLKCNICKKEFEELLPLHHCRSCGNGVCNNCSPHLRPVASRGWDTPVRVCNNCVANEIN